MLVDSLGLFFTLFRTHHIVSWRIVCVLRRVWTLLAYWTAWNVRAGTMLFAFFFLALFLFTFLLFTLFLFTIFGVRIHRGLACGGVLGTFEISLAGRLPA